MSKFAGKGRDHILTGSDAQEALLAGIQIVNDVVGSTLGPKGRNVTNRKLDGQLETTKDGVTVAKWVRPSNPFLAVGADMIKSASRNALRTAGDGTTTATVLTEALTRGLLGVVSHTLSPVQINKQLDELVGVAKHHIKEHTQPINGNIELLRRVATISANNNMELGVMVADAVNEAGDSGRVIISKTGSTKTEVRVSVGHTWDNGFIINSCVTDTESQLFQSESVGVLLLCGKMEDVDRDMLNHLYTYTTTTNNSLLVVVQEASDVVINAVYGINHQLRQQGRSQRVVLVRAAGHGNMRQAYMGDLATVLGGQVFSNEQLNWGSFDSKWFNDHLAVEVGSVTVDSHQTSIRPLDEEAEKRASELILKLKSNTEYVDEYDKLTIDKRVGILSGKLVTILVGGISEEDTGDRNDLIDDAVCAAQCARLEGILPGGGNVYRFISNQLQVSGEKGDEVLGAFCDALLAPMALILSNAGFNTPYSLIESIPEKYNPNMGIDVNTGEVIEDLLTAGIVDPAIVAISSLESAVSVTKNILMTNTIIIPEGALKGVN